ncbi:MAG TPA: helix-turn-helix transcriptional regulator [Acidimicrobiales bacterium]|nr:helix-turn-helix transcriptional regulator [Acidimicrobiales bacterium]
MQNPTDDAVLDVETAHRRGVVGEWITEQCELQGIDHRALAAELDVSVELLDAWMSGNAPMSLDQALALDRQFGLPAGTTGAEGGYFGCFATPDLEGEEVFDTREYTDLEEMRSDFDAAVELGIGVRLSNRWVPIEVDHENQSCVSEQRWVLDLMSHAPGIDPFH